MTHQSPIEPQDVAHVRHAITQALEDLEETSVSEGDRAVVLETTLQWYLRRSPSAPRFIAEEHSGASRETVLATPQVDESDILARIATTMKLPRETLEYIYDVQEGEPQLVLSPKKLPERKAEATKTIAQLLAAARQAAGLEEWTGVAAIRAVVADYGRLDTNNFAAAIQGLDKVCLLRGKGLGRQVKVTRSGMESVRDLISDLTAGDV